MLCLFPAISPFSVGPNEHTPRTTESGEDRAPLNRFEAAGISTAIGLDEAGINDDRDMQQEMRLVLSAHRVPGMEEDDGPGMGQVLRMATVGGARTTPYGEMLGTLEVGRGADMVLIDWRDIAWP